MAFAPSKRRRTQKIATATVSLNAMMDIMTIILLFLLKTYAVTGALMQPSIGNLPESTSDLQPRRTLSVVLTTDGLYADADRFAELTGEQRQGRRIVEAAELRDPEAVSLPGLEAYLDERRELERSLGKAVPSRELTVQAAGDVPYAWILKLINAATLADYDVFEFVVVRDEGAGP